MFIGVTMPYIVPKRREQMDRGAVPQDPGELNYLITQQLIKYIQHNKLSYSTINDCLGACQGASSEFYQRVVIPYEEKKMKENGDVYPKNLL